MILNGATEQIRAVLGAVVTTQQPDFFASWTDVNDDDVTPVFLPANADGLLNDTTPVVLVPSPAAGEQRQVGYIVVYNRDTAPITVTFDFWDGANSRFVGRAVLAPNQRVEWERGATWHVYDEDGALVMSGGFVSPLTTKGDLLSHDGVNDVRLPVGADSEILIARSSEPSGLIWQPDTAVVENGFEAGARGDSQISFNDGTLTFTLEPKAPATEFIVWSEETIITINSTLTKVITDTEGLWFFYVDGAGVLQATQTYSDDLILKYAWVAFIYWDATANAAIDLVDERHGRSMPSATHLYLDDTRGAAWGTGLALTNIIPDASGDLDSHAQLAVEDGRIWDEDLPTVIVDDNPQDLSPIAQIPLFYFSGIGADWRRIAATNFPVTTTGTGRMAWNNINAGGAGVWGLTEVGNNDFALAHIIAVGDINNPIVGILGQAAYATVGQARTGALVELQDLFFSGTIAQEFAAIASVIYQTADGFANAVKSKIRTTDAGDNYVDWRRNLIVPPS